MTPHSLLQTVLIAITVSFCAPFQASGAKKTVERSAINAVPATSEHLQGYSQPDSVRRRLSERPLHAVEGLWRFASEGSIMAVERASESTPSDDEEGATIYRMVVVRAADLSLPPGTVMGYLTPTAKRGVYDARIYCGRRDSGTSLDSPEKFTLSLGDSDSRLAISAYGSDLRFNWWRLLPYMYRYLFTRTDKNPGDIQGCIRIFPQASTPAEPRYL